jgi:hypothetical protein
VVHMPESWMVAGQGPHTFLVNVCEHTLHVKGLLELIIDMYVD